MKKATIWVNVPKGFRFSGEILFEDNSIIKIIDAVSNKNLDISKTNIAMIQREELSDD